MRGAARLLMARHAVLRSGYVSVASGVVVAVVPEVVEPGGWLRMCRVRVGPSRWRQRRRRLRRSSGGGRLICRCRGWCGLRWCVPVGWAPVDRDQSSHPFPMGGLRRCDRGFVGCLYRWATWTAVGRRGSTGSWRGRPVWIPLRGWRGGGGIWVRWGAPLIAPGAPAAAAAAPRDHVAVVPAELAAGVQRLARERGVTIATIIRTAWAVFLSRMTGRVTVVFGETVSGRRLILRGADQMVGLFINTVPVVVTVDDDVTLGELLDTVQHDRPRCWTIITSGWPISLRPPGIAFV